MENKTMLGHLTAILTIFIWGTTFISTKVLLQEFSPIDILLIRFTIGFLALCIIYPHRLLLEQKKQELYFIAAGLCGVTLYFLFENIALTYTFASNVGIIVSISPFFTAILAHFFLDGEKLKSQFFIGLIAALAGICLISFNGSAVLKLNPKGDILALLSAVVWACYSTLTKKISGFGYNTIQITRRIFFYGILFMLPLLYFMEFHLELERFTNPVNLLNILYLGLGASAVCFVTWTFSLTVLGAVKTSVYIYAVPVITVVTSVLILHERITPLALAGTALTLCGLFISEKKVKKPKALEP